MTFALLLTTRFYLIISRFYNDDENILLKGKIKVSYTKVVEVWCVNNRAHILTSPRYIDFQKTFELNSDAKIRRSVYRKQIKTNHLTLCRLEYFVVIYLCYDIVPPPPPSVSVLFVVQLPPNLAWQFSDVKFLKSSNSKIHSDVTMTSMTLSLLCLVSKTAENSLYQNRHCFFIFYLILFKLGRNI